MSRKYNTTTRLLNAYSNYVSQLTKRTAVWAKRGYVPVDPTPLSFDDFVANRELYKSRGVNRGNITNTIISTQLYEFNQSQATALIKSLNDFGITKIDGQKITLEKLKAGLGKKALSELNKALTASGVESGYDRANWIAENIYVDSQ